MELFKNKTDFNWKKELGIEWSTFLFNLLESEYGKNLTTFIEQVYLSGKEVYPVKKNLFNSFYNCSLKDVKVVVIDDRPVKSTKSSGIGRGVIESSSLTKDLPLELIQFRDAIYSSIYGNQYSITNFDNSLNNYCDEDMLFLNCSMCVEKNQDYTIIWKHFIRTVIKTINENKKNIVYLFLTDNNLDLCKQIDKESNKIIINSDKDLIKDSYIFLETDEYIENNYPHYNRIIW
jgi:uracil-DNA glycosylase